MKKFILTGLTATLIAGYATSAVAAPVPISAYSNESGNGLNVKWVDTSYSPHNVDEAIAALALTNGDTGYVSEINGTASTIDFADGNYSGATTESYSVPAPHSDDNFAVSYSGFINIKQDDTYTFKAFTDDGFRLMIGGEQVMEHYGDRGPGSTDAPISLKAGVYSIYMVGWEQGGAFVNELSWHGSSTPDFSVVDTSVLFTDKPVPTPLPAAGVFFLSGIAGLAGIRSRKRK